MFIHPGLASTSRIVMVDAEDPIVPDLNLQIDDIGKVYEFEGLVKLKNVRQVLTNGNKASHQYLIEIQEVIKFTEEV